MKRTLLGVLLLIAALALLTLPATSQVTPTTGATLTTTNPLQSATSYAVNTAAVAVRKDRGLGVLYSLTGADTNTVTLNFQVSANATNWAYSTPFSVTQVLAVAGTNYIGFTNFPPATFNNITYWRLGTVTAVYTNAVTNSISWYVHQ